jgi:hypothetical protein
MSNIFSLTVYIPKETLITLGSGKHSVQTHNTHENTRENNTRENTGVKHKYRNKSNAQSLFFYSIQGEQKVCKRGWTFLMINFQLSQFRPKNIAFQLNCSFLFV